MKQLTGPVSGCPITELHPRRYCRSCKAADMRRRRKENLEKPPSPFKLRTRQITANAIQTGVLKKRSCEICGEKKTEAHHPNYSFPLHVTWLCSLHHKQVHSQTRIEFLQQREEMLQQIL